MAPKINIKNHLEDGSLDLSMMELTEVPVKDIASVPKATSLDLSNNQLTTIGKNFGPSLTHLVKLDLSKNQIAALPENFGLLSNLKHLDLYENRITALPLSFGNLKHLRWLDLKDNPLMPKLAEIAGPCLSSSECVSAAKNVVELLALMNMQVEVERKRRREHMELEGEEKKALATEERKEQNKNKKKSNERITELENEITVMENFEEEERKALAAKEQQEQSQNKKKNKKKKNKEKMNEFENGSAVKDAGNECLSAGDSLANDENHLDNNAEESESRDIEPALSRIRCVFTFLILMVCIVFFVLFIVKLLDEDTYQSVIKQQLSKVQKRISVWIPKTWSKKAIRYYAMGMKSATRLSKQGMELVVHGIENAQDWHLWLNSNETLQTYFEIFKSWWQMLWIRISEMYRTVTV